MNANFCSLKAINQTNDIFTLEVLTHGYSVYSPSNNNNFALNSSFRRRMTQVLALLGFA